jgi:hypothetical protein
MATATSVASPRDRDGDQRSGEPPEAKRAPARSTPCEGRTTTSRAHLARTEWERVLKTLGRAHLAHGYLPLHVLRAIADDVGRTVDTVERRYWRDLRAGGAVRRVRLDESALAVIEDAPDLPTANDRLLASGSAVDYRSLEHSVATTPGLRLARLLRREAARRHRVETDCPICRPRDERAA